MRAGKQKTFSQSYCRCEPHSCWKEREENQPDSYWKGEGRITSTRGAQLEFTNLVLRWYRLRGIAGPNFRQSVKRCEKFVFSTLVKLRSPTNHTPRRPYKWLTCSNDRYEGKKCKKHSKLEFSVFVMYFSLLSSSSSSTRPIMPTML